MKAITVEELEKIYRENSNEKAAEILEISVTTLLRYIRKCGIEEKGSGAHNRKLKVVG